MRTPSRGCPAASFLRPLVVLALVWGSGSLLAAQSDPSSAPPRSMDAFVRAFKAAFSGNDLAAARDLFYWRGVSEAERRRIGALISADLERELVAVTILPLGAATGTTFERDGVPYAPNLELIGHLLAKFNDQDGEPHYSLHNVGVSNGVFYIGLAVPASRAGGALICVPGSGRSGYPSPSSAWRSVPEAGGCPRTSV